MRQSLRSGTFYVNVQKFSSREYKPWEIHELYLDYCDETKPALPEEVFTSILLSNKRVRTVCLQSIVDISNGEVVSQHVWVDLKSIAGVEKLKIGGSYRITAEAMHYEKFKDCVRSFDFTFTDVNVISELSKQQEAAYSNCILKYNRIVNAAKAWLEKSAD